MIALLSVPLPVLALDSREILWADCPDRLSCRKDTTSRSRICLEFKREKGQCRAGGMVGGEHISTVRVRAGQGAWFLVLFKKINGTPEHWIQGRGIQVHYIGNGQTWVKTGDGFFDIRVSAHPYGEFSLFVKQLAPK
ncbi:MAG: hypothetical protein HUK40_12530 [Desulfobacter sp.]|nr:hypothetical protein [Desulfobacter sp.]WDP83926.1 MAG: hypothetical protein HUN05_01055 [Desulfobacter sp.]